MDPYEKYGINVFGFKTKAVMFGREVKFHMLDNTKERYEAFVLGSSAAHRYRTSDMRELSGLSSFNYSVQHSTPEDYLAIFRHILQKQKPKVVIIQIDFYALNKHFATDPRLGNSPLKEYLGESKNNYFDPAISNTYLTLNALWDSLRVIGVNAFGEARHAYLEHGDYPPEKANTEVKISQAGYGTYEFDSKRIEILKELNELAQANDVRLVAVTAPLAFAHLQKIDEQGLGKTLFDFKNILRENFAEVYDFTNPGIKAYSTSDYFRDSAHPTPALSKLVLEVVFGKSEAATSDFGRALGGSSN